MSERIINLEAPAKINLHLSVSGRRQDGYHLLRTLMVKLDLADRLTLREKDSGLSLSVKGADLPEDENNLVFRAARKFLEAVPGSKGAAIELEKNIPLAAGLGGGSSDAALTLLGLNRMHQTPLGFERLLEIGLSLGADVPFFIHPLACAWAEGIGEKISPGPVLERQYLLLVNPGWPLSTSWVYKNLKLKLTSSLRNHIFSGSHESSFTIGRLLHNDLETVVLTRYPELGSIKEALMSAGAIGALMTGSGPTIFGIFPDAPTRDRAGEILEIKGSEKWKVLPACTPVG